MIRQAAAYGTAAAIGSAVGTFVGAIVGGALVSIAYSNQKSAILKMPPTVTNVTNMHESDASEEVKDGNV